jgi:hypothetical protein
MVFAQAASQLKSHLESFKQALGDDSKAVVNAIVLLEKALDNQLHIAEPSSGFQTFREKASASGEAGSSSDAPVMPERRLRSRSPHREPASVPTTLQPRHAGAPTCGTPQKVQRRGLSDLSSQSMGKPEEQDEDALGKSSHELLRKLTHPHSPKMKAGPKCDFPGVPGGHAIWGAFDSKAIHDILRNFVGNKTSANDLYVMAPFTDREILEKLCRWSRAASIHVVTREVQELVRQSDELHSAWMSGRLKLYRSKKTFHWKAFALKGEKQGDHTEADLLLTSANPSECHVQTPSALEPYNNDSYMMAETIFEAFMEIFWLRVEPTQLQPCGGVNHLQQLQPCGGAKSGLLPGDWECPQCSANVYAAKDHCYNCGAGKSDGGGPRVVHFGQISGATRISTSSGFCIRCKANISIGEQISKMPSETRWCHLACLTRYIFT